MDSTLQVTNARVFSVSGPVPAVDARHEFSRLAYGWLPAAVHADARLLVHEVVTSVVLAQGGTSIIQVRVFPIGTRGVRVEVAAPHADGIPRAARGLKMVTGLRRRVVSSIADRWGIVLDPISPYVWVELGGN